MAGRTPIFGDAGLSAKLLFTDASCFRVAQVSAWAAMLITRERSWLHSDLILDDVDHDSMVGEVAAIASALEHFAALGALQPGDRVVVHADNQTAVRHLGGLVQGRSRNAKLRAGKLRMIRVAAELGLALEFSWVKAHQGPNTDDWRGLINARVDRLARWTAKEHLRSLDATQNETAE